MLYIFAGLPGTGKSTLSAVLAQRLGALYLRIDTLEQTLRNEGVTLSGPEGYHLGYAMAADNLRLGLSVVADSVNPLELTRSAWRRVARGVGAAFREIEVQCSDRAEHRRRVESRESTVAGLRLPTWQEVLDRNYEAWSPDHLVLDTAGQTIVQSLRRLEDLLGMPPKLR